MTNHSEFQGLSPSAFDALMADVPIACPWALAVSGGSDSMALMVLAASWAEAHNKPKPFVLTVDHGLRPEAAAEVQQVAGWAASFGLESKVLVWTDAKPQTNIQSQARDARYRLLGEACLDLGARSLLTAHTLDDQAETVLLRLARGSGVDGLSAMRPLAKLPISDPRFDDVSLVRPLLSVDRASLQATLRAVGQPWLDDPSNGDSHYARVRMRKALATLAEEGIDAARLAKTAALMSRARQALDDSAASLRRRVAQFDNAGFARLNVAELMAAPQELGLRALAGILQSVGGAVYRPRLARLERLYNTLRHDLDTANQAKVRPMGQGATLAGCRIVRTSERGDYLIVREMAGLRARLNRLASAAPLRFGDRQVWDNRFEIALSAPQGSESLDWSGEIRPLGSQGLAQVAALSDCVDSMRQLPALVRPTLPALWVGDHLVAAPHLGLFDQDGFPASIGPAPAMTATFLARSTPGKPATGRAFEEI